MISVKLFSFEKWFALKKGSIQNPKLMINVQLSTEVFKVAERWKQQSGQNFIDVNQWEVVWTEGKSTNFTKQ